MIEVLEYTDKYQEITKTFLVELQKYLSEADPKKIKIVSKNFRDDYFNVIKNVIHNNKGKIFLASLNEKIVGLVIGYVQPITKEDILRTNCPKMGKISKLVVNKEQRGRGIGRILMREMEKYLIQMGCEYISLDVAGYNQNAQKLYYSEGYQDRLLNLIKRVS